MALKKYHKWLIGSLSSIIVIFMIILGISMYLIFIKQEYNYNQLNQKITDLQADTQSKISDVTESLIQTNKNLMQTNKILDMELGSLSQELDLLKASAGEDFSGIIENAIESVVTIKTSAGFQGTGFIISSNGYLVTNAHVLADKDGKLASLIQAMTYEQKTEDALFIGYNGELDLALLQISGDYDYLEFGDSDNVQIGEKVIAIGNPLGLQFSVTEGIISAIHRTGPSGTDDYIQTDTALNPGNSGGPLINKQGKVIGINNFKLGSGENLGFALESNPMVNSINEIYFEEFNETLI
jgi:S1-C subfamily serine protease